MELKLVQTIDVEKEMPNTFRNAKTKAEGRGTCVGYVVEIQFLEGKNGAAYQLNKYSNGNQKLTDSKARTVRTPFTIV